MKLKEYLDRYGIKKTHFQKMSGLDNMTLVRAIKQSNITLLTAKKIVDTCEGKVNYEDLIPEEN